MEHISQTAYDYAGVRSQLMATRSYSQPNSGSFRAPNGFPAGPKLASPGLHLGLQTCKIRSGLALGAISQAGYTYAGVRSQLMATRRYSQPKSGSFEPPNGLPAGLKFGQPGGHLQCARGINDASIWRDIMLNYFSSPLAIQAGLKWPPRA